MEMNLGSEFDAFGAGVAPGGLRNTTQIKILIGILLQDALSPPETDALLEALQLHELANYFDVTQAISAMKESGSLTEAEGVLSLTARGRLATEELRDEVPASVAETAVADLLYLQTRRRRAQENEVEILPAENGWSVRIRVADRGGPLMELRLYAADHAQAERLKENFLRDPSRVYATVVASMFI